MNRYHYTEKPHCHYLDNKKLSGTSSISGMMPKGDSLIWWAIGKALETLGWTPTKDNAQTREMTVKYFLDLIKTYNAKEYLSILDTAYKAWKADNKKTQAKGTDLHYWLEQRILWEMGKHCESAKMPEDVYGKIKPFTEWSEKNVKKWLGSEFHVYSERLWCGGIVDAIALLKDDTIALVDFKSAKDAYLGHFIQCAGYIIQLEENGMYDSEGDTIKHNIVKKTECSNCSNYKSCGLKQADKYFNADCSFWEPKYLVDHIIIFPFGAKTLKPHFNPLPIEEYKKGFEACLTNYRLSGLHGDNDKNRIIKRR